QDLLDALRVRDELGLARPDRTEVRDDVVGERTLALQAADPGGRAALVDPGEPRLVGEELVQRAHVAVVGVAGILAPGPLRIGRGGGELGADLIVALDQAERVSERLRHLRLPVETEDLRRLGEERLWLGEDLAPARVEAARNLARELEVLHLVGADGNERA